MNNTYSKKNLKNSMTRLKDSIIMSDKKGLLLKISEPFNYFIQSVSNWKVYLFIATVSKIYSLAIFYPVMFLACEIPYRNLDF